MCLVILPLMGVLYTNERGSHYFAFYSTDRQLLKTTKKILAVSNKIKDYQPKGNRKTKYTLQVGSRKAHSQLLRLGFTPDKSKSLKYPSIPSEYLPHFTRGLFDGDGCVSFGFYKRSDRQKLHFSIMARFVCSNKEFLYHLHQHLKKTSNIKGGSICRHSNAYRLLFSTQDARQLYKFMYSSTTVPCLKRKRDKFEQAFKILDP